MLLDIINLNKKIQSTLDLLDNAKERVTESFGVITTEHKYIHEGLLFSVPLKLSLATSVEHRILITTPDASTEKFIHYRPATLTTSADKVDLFLYESPTEVVTTSANELTPVNRRRINPIEALTTVLSGVTATSDGTKLDQSFIGGGETQGQSRSGDETGEENEFLLASGTQYLVVIKNNSTVTQDVLVKLKWYEEDGY